MTQLDTLRRDLGIADKVLRLKTDFSAGQLLRQRENARFFLTVIPPGERAVQVSQLKHEAERLMDIVWPGQEYDNYISATVLYATAIRMRFLPRGAALLVSAARYQRMRQVFRAFDKVNKLKGGYSHGA